MGWGVGIGETQREARASHLTSSCSQEWVLVPGAQHVLPFISFLLCDTISIVSLEFDTLLHNAAVGGKKSALIEFTHCLE